MKFQTMDKLLLGWIALITAQILAAMIVPAFTILGGGLPFLVTKPYFQDSVRWVHLGEVTTSNFLLEAVV